MVGGHTIPRTFGTGDASLEMPVLWLPVARRGRVGLTAYPNEYSVARSHCGRNVFDPHNVGRILAGVAGGAEGVLFAVASRLAQALQRKIRQRIGADVFANFIYRLVGRDQLVLGRRVHSVVTGRDGRRAGDAHVYFLRA